jgi:predicted nucleic acid-binding protein
MLDTGPLGMACHPRPNAEFAAWFTNLVQSGREIFVPEIADYELRRELIRANLNESISRLDSLESHLTYCPIETAVIRRAAEFWADARNRGTPTADDKALDGDVILAAQAERLGAIVATENVSHLSLFVTAKDWKDIR